MCLGFQIWKQKLVQMGATIELRVAKGVTHILAMNPEALLQEVGRERLGFFKGVSCTVHFGLKMKSLK